MKNSVSIFAMLFSVTMATAQVTSRKLNTTPAVLPTSGTVPVKRDTMPVNKSANNNGMVRTQNTGVAVRPVQPSQLPARDMKQTTNDNRYGNKYGGNNQQAPANAAITGVYTQQIQSGGIPVTVKYMLGKPAYAAGVSNNSGTGKGRINYQAKERQSTSEGEWNCNSEMLKVSILDDSYMKINYEAQAANIWPGAIYKFSKFINGGDDETGGRNPIVISTSNPNTSGAVTERMEQPNQDAARQAIANLYGRFTRNPADIGVASMQIHSEEIRSAAELDIKIGVSGYGGGFSGSNRFQFSKNEHSHIFLFDCTKEMFSMDSRMPPEGFFTDPARATADMMYISSVTYGLRIMALVEITDDNETVNNNFNASYNALMAGGSASIDVASKISNGKAVVNMFVVGGQSEKEFPPFNIAEMKTRLQEIIRSLTYTTAKPVRYTFRNMNNELVKYSSTTDYFYNRTCEPAGEDAKPASYTVSIPFIRLDIQDKDDVDLYGRIYAEIIDGSGAKIAPRNGTYLFNLQQNEHMSKEELKNSISKLPVNDVAFDIKGGHVAGSKLLIHYLLNDYDGGSGDDPLKIRGMQPTYTINGNRFYVQVIDLDELKKGSNIQAAAQFVDDDGDYPFTVTIAVQKQ